MLVYVCDVIIVCIVCITVCLSITVCIMYYTVLYYTVLYNFSVSIELVLCVVADESAWWRGGVLPKDYSYYIIVK